MTFVTRFAPSPTGPLHLGHAYSAITAHDMARSRGGRFLLRIEDTDQSRARPEWEERIRDDLSWLGLTWDGPVLRQSANAAAYAAALERLSGFTFPCSCNRADIRAASSAPQEGAMGPDGPIYPGTCRDGPAKPGPVAIRLHADRAADALGPLYWQEGTETIRYAPARLPHEVGDVVLSRRDPPGIAYHLAVVVDDAAQAVTDVVRGADLRDATPIHVALQALLGLPTPRYHHHRLIRDAAGRRLAKRDDARALATYRAEGATPADIRAMVGLQSGSEITRSAPSSTRV
ncbi:MAG: tRNA glutamyl-Q(34) synthetase GluQRS [Shimia sp.]